MQITANQLYIPNEINSSVYENNFKYSKNISSRNIILQEESLKGVVVVSKDERLLYKIVEIILLNNEPVKQLYLFLLEVSILYETHSQIIFQDSNKMINNVKYLENILLKIISMLEKFHKMKELEKSYVDIFKISMILNNFYIPFSEIKSTYLNFYSKLIYLSVTKTKCEIDFRARKKFYSQIFEYIFDMIQNFKEYEKSINIPEEYIKLIEIILIFLKNYSKSNVEDIYIVFKLSGIVIKKIHTQNSKNIFFIQLIMVYIMIAFICPVILA